MGITVKGKKIKDFSRKVFSKYKKVLLITGISLVSLVVLVLLFISPLTKYLVEKYDVKYTGREITMGWAYVNPFTGYIHFSDLKIYENKSDSIFLAAKGFSVNIRVRKLFLKEYEISKFILNKPRGMVIQKGVVFNFSDIVEIFVSKDEPKPTKDRVHFSVQNIEILDGQFFYQDQIVPVKYFIKNVNITSTGKSWDSDSMDIKFAFTSGADAGDVKGTMALNVSSLDYKMAVVIKKFDLALIERYLKDMMNFGSFRATLDADVKATGNFKDEEDVTASGKVAISNFHFGKDKYTDYVAFDKLVVSVKELSPKKYQYIFDSVSLKKPYIKYENYDYMDNLQAMFGRNGANVEEVSSNPNRFNLVVELARYTKELARNFVKSYYKIDRLALYNGNFVYNDFTLSEKFGIQLSPFTLISDSIDKNNRWVRASCVSGVKPYGRVDINLWLNPKDTGDFDIRYSMQNIPVTMFNPFIIAYTSYPFDRGSIVFKGNWQVRNSMIKSNNHLVIIDPRVSRAKRKKDTKWFPAPLIVAFIRERGNVVDYEIPISGSLRDPKFHWRDVIFDLIRNILVRPVTAPYRINVKSTEAEIERSITITWNMRNAELVRKQQRFMEKLATYLGRKPDARIIVYRFNYSVKEREHVLFYEAKKKYYMAKNKISRANFQAVDSARVERISIKDTLFEQYLNKNAKGVLLFTAQEKCALLVDSKIIDARMAALYKSREKAFMQFFEKRNSKGQIKIMPGNSTVPFNGFSYYKIDYVGEMPQYLRLAYKRMNDWDDEAPRKEFSDERDDAKGNYR